MYCTTAKAVKQTGVHKTSAPAVPIRSCMIYQLHQYERLYLWDDAKSTWRTAEPDGPGKFSSGPLHKTKMILKSHPMRPVPTTAMKMAAIAYCQLSSNWQSTLF